MNPYLFNSEVYRFWNLYDPKNIRFKDLLKALQAYLEKITFSQNLMCAVLRTVKVYLKNDPEDSSYFWLTLNQILIGADICPPTSKIIILKTANSDETFQFSVNGKILKNSIGSGEKLILKGLTYGDWLIEEVGTNLNFYVTTVNGDLGRKIKIFLGPKSKKIKFNNQKNQAICDNGIYYYGLIDPQKVRVPGTSTWSAVPGSSGFWDATSEKQVPPPIENVNWITPPPTNQVTATLNTANSVYISTADTQTIYKWAVLWSNGQVEEQSLANGVQSFQFDRVDPIKGQSLQLVVWYYAC